MHNAYIYTEKGTNYQGNMEAPRKPRDEIGETRAVMRFFLCSGDGYMFTKAVFHTTV